MNPKMENSYREHRRIKAIEYRKEQTKDPGGGLFFGIPRSFVLITPSLNLWEPIRQGAIEYFEQNRIRWWNGSENLPSGHLLSSQVACVNHLFILRHQKELSLKVLQTVLPDIEEALVVDGGYVEFEYIGSQQYLYEHGFSRGANCTSVDAVMFGKRRNGRKVLFLIEWKYTESYPRHNKYISERATVYDKLIDNKNGPFMEGVPHEAYYYEPFYQMMRQTLLAEKFIENREKGCDECINVHVIPNQNYELKNQITSPLFNGTDIHDVWMRRLKNPESDIPLDPTQLFHGALNTGDWKGLIDYLSKRYW
jgi:hypothetical protein